MANLIIPVTPDPYQQFTIDLDGETVDITIRFNATVQQWVMNFVGVTFSTTLNGIALVTGINLLGPFAIRELGQLWLIDTEEKNEEPGDPEAADFGDRFQLIYVELAT